MTTEKRHIRIGHFENFNGEDSILISADFDGLLELANVFVKLANGTSSFDLSNLKLLDKDFSLKIYAFNDKKNIGLRKITLDTYEWRATSEKWNEFKEKLTGMSRNSNGGHHYLDCDTIDNKDLQVIFSCDEYPMEFWNNKHHRKN